MFQNYIKIAIRNLRKNSLYTFINILGLTVGITCFVLIALFIQYETSYDSNHENAENIYRVSQIQKGNNFRGSDRFAVSPFPLASALIDQFPEVKNATTIQVDGALLDNGKLVSNERGLFADENVFDVFTIPILKGEGKSALKDPSSILLSEKLANKFFSNQEAIGQTLKFRNDKDLIVKGIIQNTPENQHLPYDYLTALPNLSYFNSRDVERWGSNNYRTYTVLQDGTNPQTLEQKLNVFRKEIVEAYQGTVSFEPTLFLQPLTEIYLDSSVNFEVKSSQSITYIYLFATIAFIILLLAAVNYMNLATANSAQRAKEIGMRKVMGANRKQLIFQLLGESFLLTIISFILALELAHLLLPLFNNLLGIAIPFSFFVNPWLFIGMLLIAFFIGGLSGLYPAAFLTSVSPVRAFRGNFLKNFRKGTGLRNVLVIGQFVTAVVLAIGSLIVYQQLNYIQNKKLGYNREEVLYIPYDDEKIHEKTAILREEFQRNPKIDKVSVSVNLPLNLYSQGIMDKWEGNETGEELFIYRNHIDHQFLDLYEIELLEGQNLPIENPNDTILRYLLNEAAVKKIGWESPIGKTLDDGIVIGVVKDFHFQPFDLEIEPLAMASKKYGYGTYGNISMKVQMEGIDKTMESIEQTMKEMFPHVPFEYQFMDESFNQLYDKETRLGKAFNAFTILSLFIACMGLFGLVSHQVLQRTKEIGIRKVLGATEFNIVKILSKDFLKLITIAIVLASPLAWYLMREWLQSFVYHIEIQWWVFAIAGFFAIGVAILTISIQSIKAALANPIDSLKNE